MRITRLNNLIALAEETIYLMNEIDEIDILLSSVRSKALQTEAENQRNKQASRLLAVQKRFLVGVDLLRKSFGTYDLGSIDTSKLTDEERRLLLILQEKVASICD